MDVFLTYQAEDFMQDDSFRRWVGNQSDDDSTFWNAWVEAHPEKQEAVEQAKEWLIGIWQEFDSLSENDCLARVVKIRRVVAAQKTRTRVDNRPVFEKYGLVTLVMLFLLGLGWLSYTNLPKQKRQSTAPIAVFPQTGNGGLVKLINKEGQPKKYSLPDGSKVTLLGGSQVTYAPTMATDSQRTVHLTGEAFFEVVKNPAHPFLVYAKEAVTRVVGTSFRVKAPAGQGSMSVAVKTGIVAVYTPEQVKEARNVATITGTGVELTLNQQAILQKDKTFKKSIVDKPALLYPQKLSSVFTDVPYLWTLFCGNLSVPTE